MFQCHLALWFLLVVEGAGSSPIPIIISLNWSLSRNKMNRSQERLYLRTFCHLTNALTFKNLHLRFINVNIGRCNVQISIEIKAFEPCLVCLFKLFFFLYFWRHLWLWGHTKNHVKCKSGVNTRKPFFPDGTADKKYKPCLSLVFFLLCLIKRCTHCQQIRQIQRAFPKQTSLMMTPPCYSRQLLLLLKVTSQQDVFYNNDTATNPLRTRLKVFVRAQIKLKCGSVGFLGRGNLGERARI